MKVLLSISSWTYSINFPAVASTAKSRARFASIAVIFLGDLGLNSINIDQEYLANNVDALNFVLLLTVTCSALDTYIAQYTPGYYFLLSVISPTRLTNYEILYLSKMNEYLDIQNLIAYDYARSQSSLTGYNTNLYPSTSDLNTTPFLTQRAITDYAAAGIPANKIVIRIPLYGRSFKGTTSLGQSFTGVRLGSQENRVQDYKVLPKAGVTEYFDPEIRALYSYNTSAKELISYDNVAEAKLKATYIKSKGLGRAMYQESSIDKSKTQSLIRTVIESFGTLDQSENQLKYLAS